MKKIVIASCPSMEKMASDLSLQVGGASAVPISWERFPDGFPNIRIKAAEMMDNHVYFLAAIESNEDIFPQISAMATIASLGVKLTIILPFFPTGTLDRSEDPGVVVTAHTLALMLSAVPHSPEIVIFDIHAQQERHFFHGPIVRDETAIPLLKKRLEDICLKNAVIAFPDSGAQKRFGYLFKAYPQIICTKVRDGDKRIVTIKEGDPVDKDVVIVDDLIQTGGTMIECAKAIRAAGAKSVSAYATHGVFPDQAWKKFTPDIFRTVWVTDSCPSRIREARQAEPFEVLSLKNLLFEFIVLRHDR